MSKRNKLSGLLLLGLLLSLQLIAVEAFAQNKGITFQGILKHPDGTVVNEPGITANLKVLAPNGCVLRDEDFSGVNITNGYINLAIGKGTPNIGDPGKTIQAIMNNTTAISGLNCLDSSNNVIASSQTYTPTSTDARKLRLSLTLDGSPVVMDFNMRSTPFAVNSETLNGKTDTAFVNTNTPQGVTQTNLESIFARFTKLDSILNNFDGTGANLGANITGNAATATNVTGTVAIANGGTGATTAAGIRTNLGLGTLATMAPAGTADNTTYLRGDGTWAAAGGGSIDGLSDARYDITTDHNLILGQKVSLTAGAQYNLFIGEGAGATAANSTAATDQNTAVGYQALQSLTSGDINTAVGFKALALNTYGGANVAVGQSALGSNISGNYNVAVGQSALSASTASGNTAVGGGALWQSTTGQYNTASGNGAMNANLTGSDNTASGMGVLASNTIGSANTAIGRYALNRNVAKGQSTAVGWFAMSNADSAVGVAVTYNTAVGAYALQGSGTAANNTGTANTALGHSALMANTSGSNNTALGYNAGRAGTANTTGSNNTFLGYQAQANGAAYTNATALGNGAIVTASNSVQIGNSAVTTVTLGAAGTATALKMVGSTSGSVSLNAGVSPAAQTYTLPSAYPGTSGYVLSSNTSGITSWVAQGGALTPWTSNINAAGYTLDGNSTSGGNLTLDSTANATKGYVLVNPTGGNVGIGTTAPGQKLEVNGGLTLNTATAKPACSSTTRGTFWVAQGTAGVKDTVEVCAKDAADAYAWRTLY